MFTLVGLLTVYLVERRRRRSGLVKEIDERRKDQETIHKQLAQLTAIYDTAPIGLCCLDTDMRYLSINHRLAEMNGRSVEDHIGRTIGDLLPELFPILDPVLQSVIATGQPALNIEIHGRTMSAHARERDFLASYYPLRNTESQVVGINVVVEDITEQKAAHAAILTSLREKAVLLKELHHRTKNNLQIISSLLSLQSAALATKQPDDMFKDIQGRIHSMALIHEQLYQSGSFSDINTDQYVKALITNITRSFGVSNVSFVISTHGVLWNPDIAMNCGLILNELLTNAFKYAFPAGEGKICVNINREQHRCIIVVQDDGIGLPEGFRLEKATSLGLQLVTTLAKQLGGTIEFLRENGTKFTIEFPVPSSD
jgi:PAS domain S-box-containing protein